jgi:putative transcriptional regulator
MKKTTTIVKMDKSGKLTRRRGEAVKTPRGKALSEAAVLAAAKADPDNPPLTAKRMTSMQRVPQIKVLRRALGLTQEEFSARYQIPLGTLRDWEQGRSQPDLPARAYLKVIARDPDAVRKALQTA